MSCVSLQQPELTERLWGPWRNVHCRCLHRTVHCMTIDLRRIFITISQLYRNECYCCCSRCRWCYYGFPIIDLSIRIIHNRCDTIFIFIFSFGVGLSCAGLSLSLRLVQAYENYELSNNTKLSRFGETKRWDKELKWTQWMMIPLKLLRFWPEMDLVRLSWCEFASGRPLNEWDLHQKILVRHSILRVHHPTDNNRGPFKQNRV